MTYENKDIIQTIKTAREAKGLSQRALSERIGVPQSHISKIENNSVQTSERATVFQYGRTYCNIRKNIFISFKPFDGIQRFVGHWWDFRVPNCVCLVLPCLRIQK